MKLIGEPMLFTNQEYQRLIENGKGDGDNDIIIPVVKWILQEYNFTFLATMIRPFGNDTETVYGYGLRRDGKEEIERLIIGSNGNHKSLLGMSARKDPDFVAAYPLNVYKQIAKEKHQLVTNADMIRALLGQPELETA